MEQNDEFIRVGTTYYKIVDQPLVNGETVKRRIPWSIEALRQDYGKNFMNQLHTNLKQVSFLVSNR